MAAAQDASGAIPVLSGDLFKQTVAFDYVVKRHVRLFSNRFETYEDPKDNPGDHRSFPLMRPPACCQPARRVSHRSAATCGPGASAA